MSEYFNVYAGKDAIDVPPWPVPRVTLIRKSELCRADGNAIDFFVPNEIEAVPLIRAIPPGFITAQFMELDLNDDEAIAQFCATWGLIASPYAGSISRAHERLLDPDAQARFLKGVHAPGEVSGRGGMTDVDAERYGRDIWYAGLADSKLDVSYSDYLGGNCWLNVFSHDASSKGTEILNAQQYRRSSTARHTLVYVEEIRQTLLLMRAAVLFAGFNALAKGDGVFALEKAARFDEETSRRSNGARPFEETLSTFLFDASTLRMSLSRNIGKGATRVMLERMSKTINANTLLFADLCLNTAPKPLVSHSGFRNGPLAEARTSPSLNRGYGTLLNAMAAQLYEYINDGNPWRSCESCGRPFKYEQQKMSPVTDESEAQKIYRLRHRATTTSFCSKRHEKKVYDKRNKEVRERMRCRKEASGD